MSRSKSVLRADKQRGEGSLDLKQLFLMLSSQSKIQICVHHQFLGNSEKEWLSGGGGWEMVSLLGASREDSWEAVTVIQGQPWAALVLFPYVQNGENATNYTGLSERTGNSNFRTTCSTQYVPPTVLRGSWIWILSILSNTLSTSVISVLWLESGAQKGEIVQL